MRISLSIILSFFFLHSLSAKCVQGNCITGKGTYLFKDGSKYTGTFLKRILHGKGVLYQKNGSVYSGDFVNGIKEGQGKIGFKTGDFYEGSFRADNMNGTGMMRFKNGDTYKGNWVEGKPNGRGKYMYKSGSVYEGSFVNGDFQGNGKLKLTDGTMYEGEWIESKKHGSVVFTAQNDKKFTQQWNMDTLVQDVSTSEGYALAFTNNVNKTKEPLKDCNTHFCDLEKGIFKYSDGSVYTGDFKDGEGFGKGECKYANGNVYTGQWKNHGPNGQGTLIYANGKIVTAFWENGKVATEAKRQAKKSAVTSNTNLSKTSDKTKVQNAGDTRVFALVVGVASYNHMQSLKYTDDDAYHLYAFLKSPEGGALPDDRIKLLIDDAATRQSVLRSLKSLTENADANDVVFIYLSGHGLDGAFVPYDFDGQNNLIQYNEIMNLLNQSEAQHKIFITDACHSGSMLAQAKNGYEFSLNNLYTAYNQTSGGTAILTSSAKNEVSLEYGGLRQGIFSHFLIRGLKGEADSNRNKLVSISELYTYISSNVKSYTANAQTPTISGDFDPEMPVAMIR